jgi:hypothetical protein
VKKGSEEVSIKDVGTGERESERNSEELALQEAWERVELVLQTTRIGKEKREPSTPTPLYRTEAQAGALPFCSAWKEAEEVVSTARPEGRMPTSEKEEARRTRNGTKKRTFHASIAFCIASLCASDGSSFLRTAIFACEVQGGWERLNRRKALAEATVWSKSGVRSCTAK